MPHLSPTVFLDVNETLSDLSGVADAFARLGAGAPAATTWFAGVLRDGFALTVAGASPAFLDVAEGTARTLLAAVVEPDRREDAVAGVLAVFAAAPAHPDVAEGVRRLHARGHRVVTLSNGAAGTAETLLESAGVAELVDAFLSVEGHSAWKPARDSYLTAAARMRTEPADATLVAAHPWDVDGAARAGFATVLVDRVGAPYPAHFLPPTRTVRSLVDLVSP